MATKDQLIGKAVEIRDADQERENTALRVGSLLLELLNYFDQGVDMETLRAVLNEYAQLNGYGITIWHQSRVVPLASMDADLDGVDGGEWTYTPATGDIYYNAARQQLRYLNTSGETEFWGCRVGVIYINLHTRRLYTWTSATGMQELSGDHVQRRVISSMVGADLNQQAVGTVVYYPDTRRLYYKYADRGWLQLPLDTNAIYCDASSDTTIRWDGTKWVSIGGGSMGKVVNANDGKIYRIWVGTQAQLDALGSNIEKDVIYLVGVVPTIEITAIGINTVEGDVNFVNLHADLYPPTTTQENVTWSIDNDIDFSIVSDGLDAVLRVLSTADDSTVNVTCRSVEKPSVSTVETLVKSYDPTVPITAITGITHSTASTNKEQFVAVVEPEGGNTPAIVWSVVATPQNAASIDTNGLLTIIDDCTVVVTATSGSNTFTTNEINLQWQQDPNAPIVWEDANMEAFMLRKVSHANPNYITYAEAANFSHDKFSAAPDTDSYQFDSIKDVVTKFNEWQYFPLLTLVNTTNWSLLEEVTMPPTVNLSSQNIFSGTAITNLVVPEGVTSLILRCLSGPEIVSISFPSTLSSISAANGSNVLSCPKLKVMDLSGTSITSVGWSRPNLGGVEILKFPPSLTSIGTSSTPIQLTRESASLAYVEIGTEDGGSSIGGLYINQYSGHNVSVIVHSTTPPAMSWSNNFISAFYVPDSAVEDYKSATGWSAFASKIKGISELPTGWDTPSTNE